jgi:hypothetical protein
VVVPVGSGKSFPFFITLFSLNTHLSSNQLFLE